MSWSKVIECDVCNSIHFFKRGVKRERTFLNARRGWCWGNSGNTNYDICPDCLGDNEPRFIIPFFRDYPISSIKEFPSMYGYICARLRRAK